MMLLSATLLAEAALMEMAQSAGNLVLMATKTMALTVSSLVLTTEALVTPWVRKLSVRKITLKDVKRVDLYGILSVMLDSMG